MDPVLFRAESSIAEQLARSILISIIYELQLRRLPTAKFHINYDYELYRSKWCHPCCNWHTEISHMLNLLIILRQYSLYVHFPKIRSENRFGMISGCSILIRFKCLSANIFILYINVSRYNVVLRLYSVKTSWEIRERSKSFTHL